MGGDRAWIIMMGVFVLGVFGFAFSVVGFDIGVTGFVIFGDDGNGTTTLTLESSEILGDARVRSSFNIRNYGISDELYVKWGSPRYNSYLSFNLSYIPANQIINSSELCLYLFNDQTSQTIYAHHVYSNWSEGSLDNAECGGSCDVTENITWDNQPCGALFDNSSNCNLSAESSASNDGAQDGTWMCWDISNMVNAEYASSSDVISVALHTEDNGNADIFYSAEYSNATLRPYVNVSYYAANDLPVVSLVSPEDKLYVSNVSLDLNFSVVDDNLDSCWFVLDVESPVMINGCLNTTFDTSEGVHNLTVYVNDSFGEVANDSVSFNVDVSGVDVELSEPVREKSSRAGIAIIYSAVGADDCWYNVETSIGGSVIGNTSLVGCNGSSFDVSADGDYVLNLFGNNSLGSLDFDSTSFSVDSSVSPPAGDGGGSSGGGGGGGGGFSLPISSLEVEPINVVASIGEEKPLSVSVKNIGRVAANKCRLVGDSIDSEGIVNIGVGEIVEFAFVLSIVDGAENLSVVCLDGVAEDVNLSVVILRPELDVSISGISFGSGSELLIGYVIEPVDSSERVLVFRIFNSIGGVVAEVSQNVSLVFGEVYEGEVLVDISEVAEGMLKIAISDEAKVSFVEEDFVYGGSSAVTGFVSLAWDGAVNWFNIVVFVFVILLGVLGWKVWELKRK